jgi:hypothetical protein
MNKLSIQKRVQILSCLVEGGSIRSTARITGTSKNTLVKLLCDLGSACAEYQDKVVRNLQCKRLQVDDIWFFWYAKEKNVPRDKKGQFGYGDVWTWTAMMLTQNSFRPGLLATETGNRLLSSWMTWLPA